MTLRQLVKSIYFYLSLTGIILCYIGLYWLFLFALVFLGVYYCVRYKKLFKHSFSSFFLLLIVVIPVSLFARVFLFELYEVPSESMEDSIFAGDLILISKLNYGPKLPQTPFDIPWVNLWFYHNRNNANTKSAEWGYRRLSGFSSIKRGDIFVFKKYNANEKMIVKRCAGLPGESIKIIDGKLSVNDIITDLSGLVKRNYNLQIVDKFKFERIADSLKLVYTIDTIGGSYTSVITVNNKQKSALESSGSIKQISPILSKEKAFPSDVYCHWTVDQLGPVKIPYKGLKLHLNQKNYLLYKDVLQQEGAKFIGFRNSTCYIDKLPVKDYLFKKNYYFVLGDNTLHSLDSRYWGFVAENAIEGKAICSFLSKDENKRNRLIKKL